VVICLVGVAAVALLFSDELLGLLRRKRPACTWWPRGPSCSP